MTHGSIINVIVPRDGFSPNMVSKLVNDPGLNVLVTADNLSDIAERCLEYSPSILLVGPQLLSALDYEEVPLLLSRDIVQEIAIVEKLDDQEMERLILKGFSGVLELAAAETSICKVIRAIAAGEIWAPRRLLSRMLKGLSAVDARLQLTHREAETLEMVAMGHSNQEIADHMNVTRETVRWHLRNLYAKTGARNRQMLRTLPELGTFADGSRKAS